MLNSNVCLRSNKSRRGWLVLALICLLLASGAWAAKKKEYDPFRMPRDQFRSSIKTIALRNALLPDGLSRPDEVGTTFESLITAELKRAGFEVVPAKEFDQLWKQGADSLGGLYDATTGKSDKAKLKELRASVAARSRSVSTPMPCSSRSSSSCARHSTGAEPPGTASSKE